MDNNLFKKLPKNYENIFFFLIFFFSNKFTFGQNKNIEDYIVYEFSDTIQKTIDKRIKQYFFNKSICAVFLSKSEYLDTLTNKIVIKYKLSVFEDNQKGIIRDKLINKSNRVIKQVDSIIPIVFEDDIIFADIGKTPPRIKGGKEGRIKVSFNLEFTIIEFDQWGNILK